MNKFLALFFTLLTCYAPLSSAAKTKIDGVIAIVDNQPILESDLQTRFQIIKDRVPNGILTDDIRRQILSQMIDETLQINYANRIGIHVSDQELDAAISNIASGMKLDIVGLQKVLTQQGIDYQRYRTQIKNEIAMNKLKGQIIRQRIVISDQEIDNFLSSDQALATNKDQIHLRHIMIRSSANSDAVAKAEAVKAKIKNEQDFIDQAIAVSDGSNALQGGDIGWRPFNQLPSLFVKALQENDGPLIGPIESNAGEHLLWVVDKKVPEGNFQEQTKVRHILISENAIRNDAQAKKLAEDLYKRIKDGEDFAQLAKTFSDDKGTALKGGDLDWVTLGRMVPEFEKTMTQTRVGETSKPFKTQFGWHILQVEGRRNEDISDKVERMNAEKALMAQKQDFVLEQWLDELRAQAFIDRK